MSRGGAKASREQKLQAIAAAALRARVDAIYRKLESEARADAHLAACEACGLEQVQPPTGDEIFEDIPRAGTVCVLCGCTTARYVCSLG